MKKLLLFFKWMAIAVLFSSASFAYAHGRGYERHGWGHHHGNHYYPRAQINYYYPQPQVNYYSPQPQYYGPQPQSYGYDPRSRAGLAGGVIGSVFGYELGRGDPVATGLGAAAGSFLGNGMGRY